MGHDEQTDPTLAWEARYAGAGPVWSGRPNATLVDVASSLPAGRALDLGCGEGGDAIWLAQQGWQVTAIDISPTAIARATQAARRAGIGQDQIRWLVQNLDTWRGEETYDLVTASFLHSMVELPRVEILRRAATLVAPGGHLLVISHAGFPPWAAHHHEPAFPTPDEEIASLDLPAGRWTALIAQTRSREATGPEGQRAILDDSVVLLRRSAQPPGTRERTRPHIPQ
jgi:SAM-dependent methyltransferase